MKTLKELFGLHQDKMLLESESTQEMIHKDNRILEVSYILLDDGSTDIRFSWEDGVTDNPEMLGAMLAHINRGTFIPQAKQALMQFGSNVQNKAFVAKVLEAWDTLDEICQDAPVIRPSEVNRANMSLPFSGDEE